MIPFKHRVISNLALPYITNLSPTDPTDRFVGGQDILTSVKGFLEKRPALDDGIFATTQFASGAVKRIAKYEKWDGSIFLMLSLTNATPWSRVYKYKVGTDSDWVHLSAAEDSTSDEPFDFVVANNHVFFGNGVLMWKYDGSNVRKWGITPPAAAPSLALAGSGLTGVYQYKIAWYNSTTGHISSPSPAGTTTAADDTVTITGNTNSDAQITHVIVYRTSAGGSKFFKHPATITYANYVASGYADSTADTALLTTEAPLAGQNDPPPASKVGEWYQGRIWTFYNDRVVHSGWEEIPIGTSDMPEECFPADNYFPFGKQVSGVASVGDPAKDGVLAVFTPGSIHSVTGDSLDTFTRGTIAEKAGLRQRATIAKYRKIVAWLDSANIVNITDGSQIREISLPIRPDIASISHPYSFMFAHTNGIDQWLILGIGSSVSQQAASLLVYDLDREHWMPPWVVAGTAGTSLETAAGTFRPIIASAGIVCELNRSVYKDGGSSGATYAGHVILGLSDITDGKIDHVGYVRYVGVEGAGDLNSNVSALVDDDPTTGAFTSLNGVTGNPRTPHLRTNGNNLIESQWATDGAPSWGRRVGVRLDWAAGANNFKAFTVDIAYETRPQ